jgi:ATP synthase protein I
VSEKPSPPDLREFGARLERLRSEAQARKEVRPGEPTTGLGMAFAVAAHMVAGLLVGCGVGYGLDRWLGTAPAMLITFFFLGVAAGGLNVYRTVRGYGMALGYRPAEEREGRSTTAGRAGSTAGHDNDKERE